MTKKEELEEIGEDTDDILEDTSSIDKKITWLIVLWIIDKMIILAMLLLLGR